MNTVWIFGGSFCSGYQTGGGARDWVAQLDADVTVWACNPQSPQSQYLMLDHAIKHHYLERLQTEPDLIIYDYPPVNRVHLPTSIPESEQSMLNFSRYKRSRTGHRYECGCESDPGDQWGTRSLTLIDKWSDWDESETLAEFTRATKRGLIEGRLPDQTQMAWTVKALDVISSKQIPYVWFSAYNENHLVADQHLDNYLDIHTLDGTVPTQIYNSKTFNHLSIQQNIMWADYFNTRIS